MTDLTPAQERYLTEIREAGTKTYNGRARGVIKALETAGLVEVDWDTRPTAKGNGIDWVEVITVTPKGPTPGEERVERARAERVGDHVLVNLAGRAESDLREAEHESVSSRVPARMLLSVVTELRERREADRG